MGFIKRTSMTMKWVFLLVYMCQMPDSSVNACGEVLTDTFGAITSPNYPMDYDNNITCEWVIYAPEGSRINVEFTDFALEFHHKCEFDYVELFDGPNASSPSIGKFCGATAPPSGFKSNTSSIRIVFITDATTTARGLRLSFSREECEIPAGGKCFLECPLEKNEFLSFKENNVTLGHCFGTDICDFNKTYVTYNFTSFTSYSLNVLTFCIEVKINGKYECVFSSKNKLSRVIIIKVMPATTALALMTTSSAWVLAPHFLTYAIHILVFVSLRIVWSLWTYDCDV